MIRLKDFDQNSILRWWSEAPQMQEGRIERVIRQGKIYQIDKTDLTYPKVRRHMEKLVRRRDFLPRNRPPTNQDYDLAAESFLEWWSNQHLQ